MAADIPYRKKDFAELTGDLLATVGRGDGNHTALTDTTEGSVVRTLVEAFARELAVCYEQLDRVYRFGFVDTAEGPALDNVVALLGVTRRPPGHVVGQVAFTRAQPAPEEIPIPAGTLVAGRGTPLFETVRDVYIAKGGLSVQVAVRSLEPGEETVEAGKLNTMPRPILGVESVTNPAGLQPMQRAESDEELRERARQTLRTTNLGTEAALKQAVVSLGLQQVAVDRDPAGGLRVVVGDPDLDDALLREADERVQEARPAGIPVRVVPAGQIRIRLTATLEMDEDHPREKREALRSAISSGVLQYVSGLRVGAPVRWAKIRNILTQQDEIIDVHPSAGLPLLEPLQDGASVAASHRRSNGDIVLASDERATQQAADIDLSLEPPLLPVWLDLELELAGDTTASGVEAVVRKTLDGLLEKSPGGQLAYADLATALGNTAVRFTDLQIRVIHERDGSVVALEPEGEPDPIGTRERPQVRKLEIGGGRDG